MQIYGKVSLIPNFQRTFFEREVGFKPTTFRLEIWHSNQLNYSRKWSGKRDSDARPQPWQGCTLTNWATSAYHPIYKYIDVFFFTLQIYGKVSLIPNFQRIFLYFYFVPLMRLELICYKAHAPKACVSANSTIEECMYRRWDSNSHDLHHYHLKVARLPISPRRYFFCPLNKTRTCTNLIQLILNQPRLPIPP